MPSAMNIITHPLLKVQELFESNWKETNDRDDFGVTEYFQNLFDTREKLSKIPLLDSKSVDRLPLHSLVRFRCMVQDTELSQEVALFASVSSTKPDENKLVCHRYSDGPRGEAAHGSDPNQDLMDLRNSYYCVSIPGETEWVKKYEQKSNVDLEAAVQGLKLENSQESSSVLPERFPFAGQDHFAAVVKTHNSDVSIGVTDMVEVIGVLAASDKVMTGDGFEIHDESDDPRIPTVHAILMRKVEDHGHPELDVDGLPSNDDVNRVTKEALAIRKELIDYITSALKGDTLAAELVLLHYLARVHSRPSGTVLGKFSLNLKESRSGSPVFEDLLRVTKTLLPKVHALPLTLKNLNDEFYFPRGDEQLSSGVLQVTRGTALVMDETALEEGTLMEKGLKNLKAISNVSLSQTLGYVFPFSNIDFQTDISLLIVSLGNSLVPVDCAITLKPEESPSTCVPPTEEQLRSFRKFISVLRLMEYKFSEEMAKEIESEFMEQRKAATATGTALMTPNELAFDISLARLVALSRGEQCLTKASWDQAVALSKQVKARG
ncbi:hypothetical protein BGZ81_004534 [Podila clonocystis]|nr:hypothetical protein BGZ81_004534 [Podila clonocystis]